MRHMHHVPGRLRVRLDGIKRNPGRAERVQNKISALAGVRRVQGNSGTGSVVIHYDPELTNAAELTEQLREFGHTAPAPPAAANCTCQLRSGQAGSGKAAGKAAEKVVWCVLEKALERSIPLLIAAIL